MKIIGYVVCALLFFWGNPLYAHEDPQKIIAGLLEQESCDGCLEVAELVVEGGTHKNVLLFKKIEKGLQEIRLQVVSHGSDNGYAYYSKIDAQAKEYLRDIMWVYRPQDGKVRRYNSILITFLDTGIPPYLVDRAGWWKFYEWSLLESRMLRGIPYTGYAFLPDVVLEWEKNAEIYSLVSMKLVIRGDVIFIATFSGYHKVNGNEKMRPQSIMIGPPNGPFTTVALKTVRFEKPDESWIAQIFHPDRLTERQTPINLRTRRGEVFAEVDFND